jgi:hypothetical protein
MGEAGRRKRGRDGNHLLVVVVVVGVLGRWGTVITDCTRFRSATRIEKTPQASIFTSTCTSSVSCDGGDESVLR